MMQEQQQCSVKALAQAFVFSVFEIPQDLTQSQREVGVWEWIRLYI